MSEVRKAGSTTSRDRSRVLNRPTIDRVGLKRALENELDEWKRLLPLAADARPDGPEGDHRADRDRLGARPRRPFRCCSHIRTTPSVALGQQPSDLPGSRATALLRAGDRWFTEDRRTGLFTSSCQPVARSAGLGGAPDVRNFRTASVIACVRRIQNLVVWEARHGIHQHRRVCRVCESFYDAGRRSS